MKQIYIILICCYMIACKNDKNSIAPLTENTFDNKVILTEAQLQLSKVETVELMHKKLSTIIKANGKVEVPPQHIVSISAPLGGYLKSSKLMPGMHVKKGDVIAIMEDPQFIQLQQDYLLAKSKRHFAELEVLRQRELANNQASSDKLLQQAQSELDIQSITMNALAEKLKLIHINVNEVSEHTISKTMKIYSPINGYVNHINVNIGKYISPTEVLFELIDPSEVYLKLHIFEKDILYIEKGQKVLAYSNVQADKKIEATVSLINSQVGEGGETLVHCKFHRVDKSILPGMYMNADIAVTQKSMFSLPEESVLHFEGKDFVFVAINKYEYELMEVNVDFKDNGFVSLKENSLLQGKRVASKGAYTLLMKLKNKEE